MVPRNSLSATKPILCGFVAALLAFMFSGCATSTNVAHTAPHSDVSRDNALVLAKHVATSIGGRVFAIAPSGSMLPTLDEGSIVTIEKVALEKLNKGDIVVYRNAAGAAVIHRLYERHDDRWYVLGDNNASIDQEMVTAGNFIGRVCAIFYTAADASAANTASTTPPQTAIASRQ